MLGASPENSISTFYEPLIDLSVVDLFSPKNAYNTRPVLISV